MRRAYSESSKLVYFFSYLLILYILWRNLTAILKKNRWIYRTKFKFILRNLIMFYRDTDLRQCDSCKYPRTWYNPINGTRSFHNMYRRLQMYWESTFLFNFTLIMYGTAYWDFFFRGESWFFVRFLPACSIQISVVENSSFCVEKIFQCGVLIFITSGGKIVNLFANGSIEGVHFSASLSIQ